MRAPTNLLQQLAEAVLDNSVSVLPALRKHWAEYEVQRRGAQVDFEAGMTVVNSPLAAYAATVLGLVSPGRHVAVLEPVPPQVVDLVRTKISMPSNSSTSRIRVRASSLWRPCTIG